MAARFQRYAIYWTPEPESAFAAFGASWFGVASSSFGLDPGLAARAKKAPARYGLHATLKAPFRLLESTAEIDLRQALDRFCAKRRAPLGGPLMLAQFQDYLGLVLSGKTADINWLASECVTHFDSFRAPLDEADRKILAGATLSAGEEGFFECFGYPYVLSEFLFHISLAGPLVKGELDIIARALGDDLLPFMGSPIKIDSLSLLGERGDGSFETVSRHRFLS